MTVYYTLHMPSCVQYRVAGPDGSGIPHLHAQYLTAHHARRAAARQHAHGPAFNVCTLLTLIRVRSLLTLIRVSSARPAPGDRESSLCVLQLREQMNVGYRVIHIYQSNVLITCMWACGLSGAATYSL